ncbi:hypothetical protein [Labrys neptuniae]|uniref:Uncharacterized protein n=1 Tax=Labrys neptuniae TaxID=376174 RepID=A0ABV3PHU2_9HYPH
METAKMMRKVAMVHPAVGNPSLSSRRHGTLRREWAVRAPATRRDRMGNRLYLDMNKENQSFDDEL